MIKVSTSKEVAARLPHNMARKSREFSAFGVDYRTTQFSAVQGLDLMDELKTIHPCEILALTDVQVDDGSWVSLASAEAINRYVRDVISIIPPMLVLKAVSDLVTDYSFGFLLNWRGVRVPPRFLDGFKAVSTANARPLESQLLQNGVTDLRALEEYYSLEDAFKMFDVVMEKGVNEALSNEAAAKAK